jgi:hypothetical protein
MEVPRALAAAFAAASPATPVSGLVGSAARGGATPGFFAPATAAASPTPAGLPSLRGLIAQKTAELAAASEARLSAVNARLRRALAALQCCVRALR